MSHFICLCGEAISAGIFPNPQLFDIVSSLTKEISLDEIVKIHQQIEDPDTFHKSILRILSHLGTSGIMDMFECENCGRLSIFARGSDKKPIFWFKLEDIAFPDVATSLRELSEKFQSGLLPPHWQET